MRRSINKKNVGVEEIVSLCARDGTWTEKRVCPKLQWQVVGSMGISVQTKVSSKAYILSGGDTAKEVLGSATYPCLGLITLKII